MATVAPGRGAGAWARLRRYGRPRVVSSASPGGVFSAPSLDGFSDLGILSHHGVPWRAMAGPAVLEPKKCKVPSQVPHTHGVMRCGETGRTSVFRVVLLIFVCGRAVSSYVSPFRINLEVCLHSIFARGVEVLNWPCRQLRNRASEIPCLLGRSSARETGCPARERQGCQLHGPNLHC